jgi:nucleolin
MGKSKPSSAKPKSDPLTAVKNGGITKAGQSAATTLKSVAKDVKNKAVKAKEQLSKKVAPAEDSDDDSASSEDESESEQSESSGSDSDEQEKTSKPSKATNGKKVAAKVSGSDSSDSDSDSDDAEAAAPAGAHLNGSASKVNGDAETSDSSDSSDAEDDSEDDEKAVPKAKTNGHKAGAAAKSGKTKGVEDAVSCLHLSETCAYPS